MNYELTAFSGLGLLIPTAYFISLNGNEAFGLSTTEVEEDVLHISRITSILLIIAYMVYVWFNMRTHHSIYDNLFTHDEHQDTDRHKDLAKNKLTLTECVVALAISLGLVSLIAVNLVEEIPKIVSDHNVSETFMGLILVPVVEKFAEHLTAIDEAYGTYSHLRTSFCDSS